MDRTDCLESILREPKKLPIGHAIDMRTYKRNRSVVIKRIGNDEFDVVEKGFFEDRFLVPLARMKKLLKSLLKKEFPRSTKIRLYDLGPAEADIHVVRKKI